MQKSGADVRSEPFALRQLLQHTAGLGDYSELADYHAAVERRDDPWSVAELLYRSRANELRYPPGIGRRYSNVGYLKVRRLIEHTTQMSLELAVQRAVFEPQGVRGTKLACERSDLHGVVMGEADAYHPGWVYHGLLVGPLHEAPQLLDRLLGGSLLAAEFVREMRSAHHVGSAISGRPWREAGYGLGLMIEMAASDGPVGHTGAGPGTTVAVYRRERSPLSLVETTRALWNAPRSALDEQKSSRCISLRCARSAPASLERRPRRVSTILRARASETPAARAQLGRTCLLRRPTQQPQELRPSPETAAASR